MAIRELRRMAALGRPLHEPQDGRGRPSSKSLFITGGIGDVLALTCFRDLPSDLETIFYATPKRADVEVLLSLLCGSSVKHVGLDDEFRRRFAWYSLPEFQRITGRTIDAVDWSISAQFPNINSTEFLGMPWLDHPLADVSRFRLPERYAVLAPFSTDKRDRNRDFTTQEFDAAMAFAKRNHVMLVVLNQGTDTPPDQLLYKVYDPKRGVINTKGVLYDLSNQTNLLEAMAVTLGATLFIGIDSAMSVVASKVLPADRLCIKTHNEHCRRWAPIYFAPHQSFEFLTADPIQRMESLTWTA